MADPAKKPTADELAKQLAELQEQHELLALEAEELRQKVAPVKPKARAKATGTFRLARPFYRLGVLHPAGALITITNEVPGSDWERVDEAAPKAEAAPAPTPAGRAVDRSI